MFRDDNQSVGYVQSVRRVLDITDTQVGCQSFLLSIIKPPVESQKGGTAVQRCSVENQKGTIAVQSLWQ